VTTGGWGADMRLGVRARASYSTYSPRSLYYSTHYLSYMIPIKSDPSKRDNTRVSMPGAPRRFSPLKRPIVRDPGEYRPWDPHKDSLIENVAELFDPTGISSHDDAKYAYEDWRRSGRDYPTYEEALDMAGAIPMFGKLKYLKAASSAPIALKRTPAILKLMNMLSSFFDVEGSIEDIKEDQLGID